ncbi:Oxysterol-binding protein- protein 9 [Allomyces javanicus]|nr:Oxysterol-binding protein- protein 9 [Allomyces javanicus]
MTSVAPDPVGLQAAAKKAAARTDPASPMPGGFGSATADDDSSVPDHGLAPSPAHSSLTVSTVSTAAEATVQPDVKVDDQHKDSLLVFLKKILGKDVDSLRIAVPLFLLEPVSNLEYLADLDHAVEHFVAAPVKSDPLDRFLSVFMLLITGLKRALRKAKKPLNPILGEVFYSHFTPSFGDADAVDASVPAASATASVAGDGLPTVYLIGEQISHHPPISAFHATCPDRGIDITIVYDVKAKYNGLSFALENKSLGTVRIADHNETYTLTYPSANIVGIVTMNMRLMWTGTCTIECAKTNLKGTLNFKEQRWFGRDTYDVSGTVTSLDNAKHVHATLSGAWNDAIHVQRTGVDAKPTPMFSVRDRATYASSVVPGDRAPPHASRRVWADVVAAMRAGDASGAAKAKHDVEHRQRAKEKERVAGTRAPFQAVYFEGDPLVPDSVRFTAGGVRLPGVGEDCRGHPAAVAAARGIGVVSAAEDEVEEVVAVVEDGDEDSESGESFEDANE